jgi:hypothetical protein
MKPIFALSALISLSLFSRSACAEDAPAPSLTPSVGVTLSPPPDPYFYNVPDFGKIYVTGVASGIAFTQSHHVAGNVNSTADWGNGQVFVQKVDGVLQFFLQAGIYSVPSLGTPYLRAEDYTEKTFNYVPQGFVKLAPTDSFSVEAGKLPTLFGAESTFTFQNVNIERGLLWNQENAVNRGVQANYTHGPLAFNLSVNDGFYSNHYSWLTGAVTWTINSSNTVELVAGGNLDHSGRSDFVTPIAQNNGQIYDLEYTWTSGPWTVEPYLQYTYTLQDTSLGLADGASTFGAAVVGKYSFNSNWSLGGRVEYITENGSAISPNLLYGPKSNAWSVTATPTYQQGIWFGRVDASYVGANKITAGDAFGSAGNDKNQGRLMLEAGALF